MDVETWSLIATLVFGLAGAVAALYGYKSFRASKAQLEIARSQVEDSKEQLELARDQASQVPKIELMEMSVHHLADDPELREEIRDAAREMRELRRERAEEERAEREREEREKREREERERREREAAERKAGFNAETAGKMEGLNLSDLLGRMAEPPKPLIDPSWNRPLIDVPNLPIRPMPDLTPPRYVYEGPLPNFYLDVGIRNVGRAAAYDVTGWLWLDKGVLEPVEYFTDADIEVAGEEHGRVKVELSVRNEGGRLFPSRNDPYTFRVPVLVHEAVDTPVEFEFTSPQGEPAHGTFNLLLASGGRRE